jgi:hypothetical protein
MKIIGMGFFSAVWIQVPEELLSSGPDESVPKERERLCQYGYL